MPSFLLNWFSFSRTWKVVNIKDHIPLVLKLPGRWSPGGEKKAWKLAALLTAVDLSDWLQERNKEQNKRETGFLWVTHRSKQNVSSLFLKLVEVSTSVRSFRKNLLPTSKPAVSYLFITRSLVQSVAHGVGLNLMAFPNHQTFQSRPKSFSRSWATSSWLLL